MDGCETNYRWRCPVIKSGKLKYITKAFADEYNSIISIDDCATARKLKEHALTDIYVDDGNVQLDIFRTHNIILFIFDDYLRMIFHRLEWPYHYADAISIQEETIREIDRLFHFKKLVKTGYIIENSNGTSKEILAGSHSQKQRRSSLWVATRVIDDIAKVGWVLDQEMIEGYFMAWRDHYIESLAVSRVKYPDFVPKIDIVAEYAEIETHIAKILLSYDKKGYEVMWRSPSASA